MAKTVKKRNPQDATFRNVRSAGWKIRDLRKRVTALEEAVKNLQKPRGRS